MNKLTALLVCISSVWLHAQRLYLYPSNVIAPRGTYQTMTAIVNGVNDKTVSWTASGGRIVGANPCAVNEPCTISVFSATPETIKVTAVSNANHKVSQTSTVTFTASPTPRTDHPRFLFTSESVVKLRAKAVARNPLYQSIKQLATAAYERDKSVWSWSCNAGSGKPKSDQSQSWKEQDAYLFALMSEIAPTKEERDRWGCYGHDVFLTVAGYVLSGALDLTKGNHWSDSAIQITLTPDWLMGGGYLKTPEDLSTTRAYMAKIAYQQINNIYNGVLAVIGAYDSPAQFNQKDENSTTGMRGMGNNYTHSRILYLTAAALTFNDDATDDPPLSNTCHATRYQICKDGTAGSLHAYWKYVTGGMFYKDWANMDDPAVVQQAYNAAFKNMPSTPMCNTLWHAAIPCLGGGRGGESSEGTSYGASLARLRLAINAIHTAGYDDPLIYGPQMSLGTSSYWDLRAIADFSLLTGLSGTASEPSRWTYFTNGDTLYYFTYPSVYATEAALLAADASVGRTDRAPMLQWLLMNTAFGMANGRVGGCSSYCGIDNEISNDYGSLSTLDMFLGLPGTDPVANSPADPRPALPTDWYDAGNQHIVARSGWGTNTNTIFSYYCTNTQIDHEHQYCGGFSVYNKGEYVTKGRTEFNDYINEYSAARNQNVPALINNPGDKNCTRDNCYFVDAAELGGQFWHGYQAGLNLLHHAELPAYVAAIVASTNSYNGGWGNFSSLNGITQASRSLLYLRGSNQVITYDRGDSGTHAWSKANYLVATGAPAFTGNTASWLTRSKKQRVFWTTLSPAGKNPVLDATYAGSSHAADDWEIYGRIKADAGTVPSARFLGVLEWGGASFSKTPASLVRSASGQTFEGALIGSSLVMFMKDWPASLTTVTYAASGATAQYVSDLSPNTEYSISAPGAPEKAQTDSAGMLAFKADGTGSVTITKRAR